jgi:hypothetical protein
MPSATAASGPGYTKATFPPGDGGGGAGGGKKKKGTGMGMGFLNRLIDPGLLRQAMLQGLQQREMGFTEWQKNQQQNRWLAEEANKRAAAGSTREEDYFRNRNIPGGRAAVAAMTGGAGSPRTSSSLW